MNSGNSLAIMSRIVGHSGAAWSPSRRRSRSPAPTSPRWTSPRSAPAGHPLGVARLPSRLPHLLRHGPRSLPRVGRPPAVCKRERPDPGDGQDGDPVLTNAARSAEHGVHRDPAITHGHTDPEGLGRNSHRHRLLQGSPRTCSNHGAQRVRQARTSAVHSRQRLHNRHSLGYTHFGQGRPLLRGRSP